MLDWLRRNPREEPVIDLDGKDVPIVIRRHDRARRLTMRLAPDGSEVRITIPTWTRTAEAIAFAGSRRDWLARQLASLPVAEPLAHGAQIRFRGEILVIRHDPLAPRRAVHGAGAVSLGGPESSLQSRLRRWLEGEARTLMADDLIEYCTRAQVDAPKLALSSAKRRWGSCAPDGSIRINWRLIMAPDFVRRSVVAHEVAHLIHFDHSPAFHACLDGLFEGDIRAANAWLKAHGRELYLSFG